MNASERTLRWGILSTADIALKKVIPAMQQAANASVSAIASRDLARARQAASQLGIPRAYGSYEALIADPEIDAIYIALPNHLHVDWTLKAAQAGKHVLCEKPIGLDAEDATRLRGCPPGIQVAEAFMVRHHPQWLRLRALARSGDLGAVSVVRGVFSYFNTDPANVRNMADIGGGALLDIGCYPLTAARFVFDSEPQRVLALIERDATFGTDKQASVIADFGAGQHLTFTVSTQLVAHQSLELIGTKARAELLVPFNAPANQATAILIDHGLSPDGHLSRREILPPCDQYTLQTEAFGAAILNATPLPWGIDDAIASMRALDACFESARTGTWVALPAV